MKSRKKFETLLKKVERRLQQDSERGIFPVKEGFSTYSESVQWVYPPIIHSWKEQNGKITFNISIAPFDPKTTSVAQHNLSKMHFSESWKNCLGGKNPPQKRVRPQHERDKKLVLSKKTKMISPKESGTGQQQTTRTYMDALIEKEIDKVELAKNMGTVEKKVKDRLKKAKYRFKKHEFK